MNTFNELVDSIEDAKQAVLEVDITLFCANPKTDGEGNILPEIITYREPGVDELFVAMGDIGALRKRSPGIAPDTAFNAAMLALCHLTPEPKPGPDEPSAGDLYLRLATQKEPMLFLYLLGKFKERFPWTQFLLAGGSEKNG